MHVKQPVPSRGDTSGDGGDRSIHAAAGRVVFQAIWSGESFGNSATAVATFKLDIGRLGTPGDYVNGVGNWLTDIDLIVSGAQAGNGRFTTPDFVGALFHYSGTLDFNRQLVEQSGFLDFNLFGGHGSPEGSYGKELTLPGEPGERMLLIWLTAASAGAFTGRGAFS